MGIQMPMDIWIPLSYLQPNMGMLGNLGGFLGILKDYPLPNTT